MLLSQSRLEFFASLSHEQSEFYRQENNKNYFKLLFMCNNNMELTEEQVLEFKSITNNFPSPDTAAQELKILNGESCGDCNV